MASGRRRRPASPRGPSSRASRPSGGAARRVRAARDLQPSCSPPCGPRLLLCYFLLPSMVGTTNDWLIHLTGRAEMLQRLAAWCYRRRRSVVVLWIAALVAISVIGANV